MTPWLTYTAITLLIGLLFGWLLWRQNKQSQKRWLISKIKQNPPQKDTYIKALSELNQQSTKNSKTTLWLLLVLIPAGLLLNAFLFPPQPQQSQQPPSIEEALAQLEQSLKDNPNDLEGQMLYGGAMMRLQNYDAAVTTFKKANELAPNNANILTELAEAVAFKNNTGSFLGEPQKYIDQALKADPNHQKALWLKGIIAYEQQNFAQAESLWTSLIEKINDDNVKATIIKQINQARGQQNKPPLVQSQVADGTSENQANETNESVSYQVTIEANEAIKKQQFPATTRLFVSAKSESGPPMPVAAIDVAPPFNWPISIELTDQHNLTPNRRLSDFAQVILSARLSLSGDASVSDYVSNKVTVLAEESQTILKLTTP